MLRLFSILIAGTILYAAVPPETAVAKPGYNNFDYSGSGRIYYYGEYHSKKPVHGYSGWHPGPYRQFCDYDRIPVRKCKPNGRCYIAKWILRPYCY